MAQLKQPGQQMAQQQAQGPTPPTPGLSTPNTMPMTPPGSKQNPWPMPPMASVPPPAQLGPFEPLPREGQAQQQPDIAQLLQQLLGGLSG